MNIATCADVELRVQYTATCVDEGWNTVQYSFGMQLVQMRSIHTLVTCYCNLADEGWNSGCNIHVL